MQHETTACHAAPSGSDVLPAYERHGVSFSLRNKLFRVLWTMAWLLLCRWTPPQFHGWRRWVLRRFGARVASNARIYSSCRIWIPHNLVIGEGALIGQRVHLYNQGLIVVGARAVLSWGAVICASTHDVRDPLFPLLLRPVTIEPDAWIAAEAFVGPGVTIGSGAVLGARGVAMRALDPWTFYSGNPATRLKARRPLP